MNPEFHLHDYSSEPRLRDIPRTVWNLPRITLLSLIRLYQMTISKGLPANTCRFYPSCSEYMREALLQYGVGRGSWLAVRRLVRCHPFHPGGDDPVPPRALRTWKET